MKPARAQSLLPTLDPVEVYPVSGPILGIDPSLRGNALCLVRQGAPLIEERYSTDPVETVRDRCARNRTLVLPALRLVKRHAVRVAFIEGPTYSQNTGKAFDRAGYRWVLYQSLNSQGVLIVELNPTWIKLFAADYGSAEKRDVKNGLEVRYKHAPFGKSKASEDTADAFAAAMLGCAATGRVACETAGQRHAVEQAVRLLKQEASAR